MPRAPRHIAVVLMLASAALLAGCSKNTSLLTGTNDINTASTAPVSYEALGALGKKWQSDPTDVKNGLAYANGLESVGQLNEQLAVYKKLVETNPGNATLLSLYGRKLAAAGHAAEAVPVLERAAQDTGADWRVYSALGSAYDEQGLYQKARAQYQKALAGDPQNLTVLNNLGMSYALEGNLKQAETTLRQADALPNAASEPRIRQNLALVIGLQGRFEEASKLASQDLPPEQVEENMAYLRKMLSQPNTWQQMSDGGTNG